MQRHGGSRSGICHTDTCANYRIRKSERLEERQFRQYLRLLQLRWALSQHAGHRFGGGTRLCVIGSALLGAELQPDVPGDGLHRPWAGRN